MKSQGAANQPRNGRGSTSFAWQAPILAEKFAVM
jgi:hypothetical protein